MTRCAVWAPYTGVSTLVLAALLLGLACTSAYLGRRLHAPLRARPPGAYVGGALVVVWLVVVATFVVAALVYMRAEPSAPDMPASPIAPVTAISASITFVLIVYLVRKETLQVAVGSALVGTLAAPMIFEVPFDLIVMWRTCPPSPPLLYFLPLLMVAGASFALLALSPATLLTRHTLFCLAAMLLVFAIWALVGFGYPDDPLSATLNAVGKVLAFVVAASLYLPERSASVAAVRPARDVGE